MKEFHAAGLIATSGLADLSSPIHMGQKASR